MHYNTIQPMSHPIPEKDDTMVLFHYYCFLDKISGKNQHHDEISRHNNFFLSGNLKYTCCWKMYRRVRHHTCLGSIRDGSDRNPDNCRIWPYRIRNVSSTERVSCNYNRYWLYREAAPHDHSEVGGKKRFGFSLRAMLSLSRLTKSKFANWDDEVVLQLWHWSSELGWMWKGGRKIGASPAICS